MKPALLYILFFTSLSATAQSHSDIYSDWCKMGLKGKVKEMSSSYSIVLKDSNNFKLEPPFEDETYKFSSSGYITTHIKSKNCFYILGKHQYFIKQEKVVGKTISYLYARNMVQWKDSLHFSSLRENSYLELHYTNKEHALNPKKALYVYDQNNNIKTITTTHNNATITEKVYSYNNAQQLVRIKHLIDAPDKRNITFAVTGRDTNGNPTELSYTDNSNGLVYKRIYYITYTYYD